MKVRHKATGLEIEVRKPLRDIEYYSTPGGSMIHVDDPAFEVVPEEVWEDVTSRYGKEGSVRQTLTLYSNEHMKFIDGIHNGLAIIVERRKE